jgi:hypothetical protein
MPGALSKPNSTPNKGAEPVAAAEPNLSARTVATAIAALAAAWIAAGSIGMLAAPLRLALFWLAVLVVLLFGGLPRADQWRWWASAVAALLLPRLLPMNPAVDVLAVAVLLAAIGQAAEGRRRAILRAVAASVLIFGLWRVLCETSPGMWLAADAVAGGLGSLAGWLAARPLNVGPTLGALDVLVLSALAAVFCLRLSPTPHAGRIAWTVAGLVLVHFVYLAVLAWSADLLAALPEPPRPPETDLYKPPPWHGLAAARSVIPWNLPALAAVLHAAVLALLLRWSAWTDRERQQADAQSLAGWRRTLHDMGPAGFALALALLAALPAGPGQLRGKHVVADAQGYLNWQKPEFGRYGRRGAGMYGMLPELVTTLGGQMTLSPELAEEDLAEADVLVLLHPVEPWPEERLRRVWDYVRRGGALLLVAEARVRQAELVSAFDEILAAQSDSPPLAVRFDTAIGATPRWEQATAAIGPTARTAADAKNGCLGTAVGASLDVAWPAQPILLGRYGWSDPGSDAAMTRIWQIDAGERLGDLVLAAEAGLGAGRVAVVGDTTALQNENLMRSYPFVARLLGRLADGEMVAAPPWRQGLALLAAAGLIWRDDAAALLTAALVLLIGIGLSSGMRLTGTTILPEPDGGEAAMPVAFIDAGHQNAFSPQGWSPEGLNGLGLSLMRNGYFPMLADDLSPARLGRCKVLVSIAPSRPYSAAERAAVIDFVEKGGIFICTVGAEEAAASNRLLAEFGMRVPPSPVPPEANALEPAPMGCFRTSFLDLGDYRAEVLFYAGWPIEYQEPAHFWVRGFEDRPVVAVEQRGRGFVVLVGDTAFLTNKNLETADGAPIGGRRENAHFLRWLISHLTDRPQWEPPKPPPPVSPDDDQAVGLPQEAEAVDDRAPEEAAPDDTAPESPAPPPEPAEEAAP